MAEHLWEKVKLNVTWITFVNHIHRGKQLQCFYDVHPTAINEAKVPLSKLYDLKKAEKQELVTLL